MEHEGSSRGARARIAAIATGLALVLSGCPTDEPEPDPQEPTFHPPDAPGPFAAGTDDHQLVSRDGLTLPVQVWFPAEPREDDPYRYDDLLDAGVPDHAVPACAAPHPAIVFTHGNSGIRYQTYSVMEFLATHGYVVAAPDHVHNTFLDHDQDLWAWLALRRPHDVADTFDWLAAEADDPASPYHGCLDPAAGYAVIGHSFGGFTTFAVAGAPLDLSVLAAWCAGSDEEGCEYVDAWLDAHPGETISDRSDPRTWAGVPWEPAWHEVFGDGLAEIGVPMLVVGGDRDTLTPWESAVVPTYEGLVTTPRALARLEDAGHYSLTDMCGILPGEFNGCGDDFRPPEEVLETTRTLTLAFLQWVQGQDEAADWLPPEAGIDHWEIVE